MKRTQRNGSILMGKYISTTLLFLYFSLFAMFGVGAYPGYIAYTQPDGTVINIRLKGDEFGRMALSEDGYTLLADETGRYCYAKNDLPSGDLVASAVPYLLQSTRGASALFQSEGIVKGATFGNGQLIEIAKARQSANGQTVRSSSTRSVVGTKRVLVVLAEFPDFSFVKSNAEFNDLCNMQGYTSGGASGSVSDYYKEASGGKLNLQIDVIGPYKVSKNMSYYGGNNSGKGNDKAPHLMVYEACMLAGAKVDFRNYDNDNDGVVDGVHVVFAGYGEEASADPDNIWSHKATFTTPFVVGGSKVATYSCSPELRDGKGSGITRIGVMCHELGHVFGATDFYDTDADGSGGYYQGTGMWDLMGSGNWNQDGVLPAHPNPYVKAYSYGWITPTIIKSGGDYTLNAVQTGELYRIDTKTAGEYFLLENRQLTGFDRAIPGNGMLIYRNSMELGVLPPNSTHPQRFYPVFAASSTAFPNSNPLSYGSINTSACPFPGSAKVAQFIDQGVPSAKSLSGIATGLPLTDIKTEGGVVSFSITSSSAPAVETMDASDITPTTAVLNGVVTPGTSEVVERGVVYNRKGSLSFVKLTSSSDQISLKAQGLTPESWYEVVAYAISANGDRVNGQKIEFKTVPLLPTSIDEQKEKNIKVFSTDGAIIIEGGENLKEVVIYSVAGLIVYSVSDCAGRVVFLCGVGAYVVKVCASDGVIETFRVIVR